MKTRILMLAALVASLLLGTVATALAQETTADTPGSRPVVVLVDLSGSLSESDLEEEVRAVLLLNSFPNIELYVIGFASEGTKDAWEVICEPGDDLGECTSDVERRTDAEGNDTDHAAALAAAEFMLTRLGDGDELPGLVIIMTDGRYDPNGVGETPADSDRLEAARARLKDADAEVWPLGFGNARQEDLDRLALKGPLSCDEPTGVIAYKGDDIIKTLSQVLGNATCSPEAGPQLEVPDDSEVTLWYVESELPGETVEITPESGETVDIPCTFDEGANVWTCTATTNDIDAGTWTITPEPTLAPVIRPLPGPGPNTPATTVATTASDTASTTAVATTTTVAEDGDGEASSLPWWILLVLAAIGTIAGLVYALTRPKLPRGYIAVRKNDGEWSPGETVRSEERQVFEVEVDGQYPSIVRTTAGVPDVILEASRKGVYISGAMVPEAVTIRLNKEIEIDEDITVRYTTTLDDDYTGSPNDYLEEVPDDDLDDDLI